MTCNSEWWLTALKYYFTTFYVVLRPRCINVSTKLQIILTKFFRLPHSTPSQDFNGRKPIIVQLMLKIWPVLMHLDLQVKKREMPFLDLSLKHEFRQHIIISCKRKRFKMTYLLASWRHYLCTLKKYHYLSRMKIKYTSVLLSIVDSIVLRYTIILWSNYYI